jgi:methionine-rich copper-binding protein CopC
MKTSISLSITAALTLATLAFGQGGSITATPVTATPSDHAHLITAPTRVTLTFPKAVNLKGAVFKVYVYPLSVMMKGDGAMSGAEMDVFAKAAARKFLAIKRDTTDRVDTGLIGTKSLTSQVVIGLKTNLKPGVYVTGWSITSNAQKPSTGFVHFHFETGMTMPGSK